MKYYETPQLLLYSLGQDVLTGSTDMDEYDDKKGWKESWGGND